MEEITKNAKVTLKSFLGTINPTRPTHNDENYWRLIGEKGIVIDDAGINYDKVLVLFDNNLDDSKVINHNLVKNSLWIKKTDLEIQKKNFSIFELENWLVKKGVKNTYTPGNRFETDEGSGLEIIDGLYIWYDCERGERQNLKYFLTESEAAEYIYYSLKKELNIL